LTARENRSKTVGSCIKALNEIATHNAVTIYWIPGHSNYIGNCIADRLAREGTLLETVSLKEILPPMSLIKGKAEHQAKERANR